MIGYSLSFCVKDIIEGRVDLKDVEKIIANTCAPDDEAWMRITSIYAGVYWRKNPFRAVEIANKLWAEGKIEQPRLTDPEYTHYIGASHWEAT
jgi:hypothetical protein